MQKWGEVTHNKAARWIITLHGNEATRSYIFKDVKIPKDMKIKSLRTVKMRNERCVVTAKFIHQRLFFDRRGIMSHNIYTKMRQQDLQSCEKMKSLRMWMRNESRRNGKNHSAVDLLLQKSKNTETWVQVSGHHLFAKRLCCHLSLCIASLWMAMQVRARQE